MDGGFQNRFIAATEKVNRTALKFAQGWGGSLIVQQRIRNHNRRSAPPAIK